MSLSPSVAAIQISTNFFRKLVQQRHLVMNFVVRDLKMRYVGSFMGFFWSVVNPLVLLSCYTFVFSIVFKIRPATSATDNFAVFLFCGILPWLYFQDTLIRCSGTILENSSLIRKTLFPSEILPLSLVLSNLVYHLIGLAILGVVLVWHGTVAWTALLLLAFLIPLMFLCLGLGWLVAVLQVFLRDTVHVLNVVLIFWFWFTPVFYTVDMVPERFRFFLKLNPLTAVVEGYREVLLERKVPALETIALVWVVAALAFVLGGLAFRTTKREFVDVL